MGSSIENTFAQLPPSLYGELAALDILEEVTETQTAQYRYRALPTPSQKEKINQTVGCVRKFWNLLVEALYAHLEAVGYESGKIPPSYKSALPRASEVRAKFPYMREADSLAFSAANMRFRVAVERFNKTAIEGKPVYRKSARRKAKNDGYELTFRDLKGMPRFHAKFRSKDAYSTANQHGTVAVAPLMMEDGTPSRRHALLRLPKMGTRLKIRLHRPLPDGAVIKTATVSRDSVGEYSVAIAFSVEKRLVRVKRDGMDKFRAFLRAHAKELCLGLDYAQKEGCVPSDAAVFEEILGAFDKPYCAAQSKLAALQRKLARRQGRDRSKKQEPSNRWQKLAARIAKLHRHVANLRKDALEKLSRHIADRFLMVAVEDIDLRALSQTLHLAKRLLDNGFGRFRQMLKQKLEACGRFFSVVDRWFPSSQTCHNCGELNAETKDLRVRHVTCNHCGAEYDRDENAALNIRDEGINAIAPAQEKKPSLTDRMRAGRWKNKRAG